MLLRSWTKAIFSPNLAYFVDFRPGKKKAASGTFPCLQVRCELCLCHGWTVLQPLVVWHCGHWVDYIIIKEFGTCDWGSENQLSIFLLLSTLETIPRFLLPPALLKWSSDSRSCWNLVAFHIVRAVKIQNFLLSNCWEIGLNIICQIKALLDWYLSLLFLYNI